VVLNVSVVTGSFSHLVINCKGCSYMRLFLLSMVIMVAMNLVTSVGLASSSLCLASYRYSHQQTWLIGQPILEHIMIPRTGFLVKEEIHPWKEKKDITFYSIKEKKEQVLWKKKDAFYLNDMRFYDQHYWVEVNRYPSSLKDALLIFYKDGVAFKQYDMSHLGNHYTWIQNNSTDAYDPAFFEWINTHNEPPYYTMGIPEMKGEYLYISLFVGYLAKFHIKTGKMTKIHCPNGKCPQPVSYSCQTMIVDNLTDVPVFASGFHCYYPPKDHPILVKLKPGHKVVRPKGEPPVAKHSLFFLVTPVATDGVKPEIKGWIHRSTVRCL